MDRIWDKIVEGVVDELAGRSGFQNVLDDMDQDDTEDLCKELRRAVLHAAYESIELEIMNR
jgi:hypothetical protein